MAALVAADIPNGSYVNIGIGMPERVIQFLKPEQKVILHSENGILGMGPEPAEGEEDFELINAGKKPVTLLAGGAYFDHVYSFAMMRGGHIDLCIMGAMQVSEKGDLANWSLGREGEPPAVGGAMDLAVGAKQVFIIMEHTTREGKAKLVKECTLALTGRGVVDRIYTDIAVLQVTDSGLKVLRMVDGMTFEHLQSHTEARIVR